MNTMKHYRLFQAWQNQNKEYTNFITEIIQQVVKAEYKKGIDINVIRFPAQNEAGSPDVVDMVWEQIANCDLFVGDLTAVARIGEQSISNPNVMYEVGIADTLLGEKRVILVCSKETDIAKLAFDVNHKRISPLNIRNEKAAETLQEWIEAGIAECDIQQFQRDFVLRSLYDDLYIVYNNFMRMIFTNDFSYTNGVEVPNIEVIKTKLRDASFNELMISIDYRGVLVRLKDEIRTLYENNDKRYIAEIVCIYKALDKFNWFLHTIKKSVAFYEKETRCQVLLQNTKAFYLTDVSAFDELYGSILFEEKYVYINGDPPFQNVYLKEMITERVKELCHYQNVFMRNGTQTGMNMSTYSLKTEAVATFSGSIYDVLIAIYNFMDKMNFAPTNENTEINCNTIIIWKKKK